MTRFVLSIAALLLAPSIANAQCGDGDCAVGAIGTGGEKSEGKAQGFHDAHPSIGFPGSSFSNVGNSDAGRIDISDPDQGTLSGTFRDGSNRGRGTGVFGDFTGKE